MRPAGRGPLESLYFNYPIFQPRPEPPPGDAFAHPPVAIVGAGPIGMTAALTLAKYGVRSVVLEAKSTFNDGSRAICIARQSMQILQQIGAVEPFVRHALSWRQGRTYYRGQEILRFEMPHSADEKYLPMYNLQQQYTEQYLHDAVARNPLIDMRWQSEVTGLHQTEDGVDLSVKSPLGSYRLRTSYVLAADGARSPTRTMLGLRLQGQNFEGNYVIADVRMAHDYPTERRAFFAPSSNPDGTVLVHKQPNDIWRIDYQLPDGESIEDAMAEANIRTRVGAILRDIHHTDPWELEWWSVYTANTLCLDDYRHGRVFFVGDSAHIVPIFGVRGLNNGLADAQNIGWKLAYVMTGAAGQALLDSYTPERRGATLDVFANAGKSTRFMTPPTPGWKLAREAALSLALRHPFAGNLANPRQMAPHTYADSPLSCPADANAGFASGPSIGAASLNARLGDGTFLLDRVGDGFSGLLFCETKPDERLRRMLDQLQACDPRFRALTIATRGSEWRGADISDAAGSIARIFDAGPATFYLLRPDLHVAGRWRAVVPDEVVRCLAACLGGPTQ